VRRVAVGTEVSARPVGLIRDRGLYGLVSVTGMIGIAGAMVVTSVSLFLTTEVGVDAFLVGLFFAVRAISEIACDLVVGDLSDRLRSRRQLLALLSAFSAAGAVGYALIDGYWVLMLTGAVFFGIGGSTFGQLFAYTREFADSRAVEAAFFTSALRSVTSVAWIVGPPIGFWLLASHGFGPMFLIAAGLYGLSGILCAAFLPRTVDASGHDGARIGVLRTLRGLDRTASTLLAVIALLLTVNSMYQIDIALFVTESLDMSVGFAGVLLGLTAAIEVPMMLLVGSHATRIGKWRMVLLAALVACAFFTVLPIARGAGALLGLQVLNAFWTSIALSIPVTILQDGMPDRPGASSALYSGAFKTGTFVGGLLAGSVAEVLGYANVFWACAALSGVAAVLLLWRRPA
jgi:SET family sugar efflux transporter-like MFS transporter